MAVGGTVSDALGQAGVRLGNLEPGRLKVKRRHEGRLLPVDYNPTRPDILRLVVSGGEEIHWQKDQHDVR